MPQSSAELRKALKINRRPPYPGLLTIPQRRMATGLSLVFVAIFALVVWRAGKREFRLLRNGAPIPEAQVYFMEVPLPKNGRFLTFQWLDLPDSARVPVAPDGVVRLPWRFPVGRRRTGMLNIIKDSSADSFSIPWSDELLELDFTDTACLVTTSYRFLGIPIGTQTTIMRQTLPPTPRAP